MKIKGRDSLKRKLLAIPKVARAEIRKVLEQSATEMRDLAIAFAPQQSGDLKRSIGFTFGEYRPDNENVRGVTAGGGALGDKDLTVTIHAGDRKAFYAAFVEFGTAPRENKGKFAGTTHPGTPAQPFFFVAYRLLKKRVRGRLARSYGKAAKAVAAGRR